MPTPVDKVNENHMKRDKNSNFIRKVVTLNFAVGGVYM